MAWNVGKAVGGVGKSLSDTAGKVGGWVDKNNPYVEGPRKAKDAKKESNDAASDLYTKTGELNKGLSNSDTLYQGAYNSASKNYLNQAGGLVKDYTSKINALDKQSQDQASDARQTYTNSILPEYKNAMGMAATNASQAMNLSQAGDPNNPIMKAVRDLYDQQGQAARTQGQQDYGVLSALGAQAAKGQFGAAGGPMTSGQMGQIYAANQNQAGNAYSKAQQRMYDLQQQGIDRGFDQSNQMYQFGQQAQDRYSNTIKDVQNSQDQFANQQGNFRNESSGYAGDTFGVNSVLNSDRFNMGMGSADIAKGNAYAGAGRSQDALNQLYGVKQQNINNTLQAEEENQKGKAGIIGSGIGAYGSYLGRNSTGGSTTGATK